MNYEGTKTLADEIVRLEKLQHDGIHEYEYFTTTVHTRPIAARLRELHKQLADTGKGPLMGAY